MESWTDTKTGLTCWRCDTNQDFIYLLNRYKLLNWKDIAAVYSCSRMTAYRCLRGIQNDTPHHLFAILHRYPGHIASTERMAPKIDVHKWMIRRNSVGNPRFNESGYQAELASRPRKRRL